MEPKPIDLVCNIDIHQLEPDVAAPPEIPRPKRFLERLRRSQNVVIGGVLFLAALGFNLYRLGTPSIWFDEAFSVELAHQPLPLLWHILFGVEPNMELYYLFLHFWLQLTGALGLIPTEFVVRLPSAIFAALSTLALFVFGRRFLGVWAGVVGASLYLLNDLQLTYAQETRGYSLQLLLLCLAWYALFTAFTNETRTRRWWLCYVVTITLAFYTHLFSVLIFLAQLTTVAGLVLVPNSWRVQIRKRLLAFGASLLASGILSIPMMILVSRRGSITGWLPLPHLQNVFILFFNISANSKIYLALLVAFCGLGLFAALLSHLPPHTPLQNVLTTHASGKEEETLRQRLPMAFALLCWLILPVVISYVVSQGHTRLFSTRYLVTIVPPLCLLVGLGVATLRSQGVKIALAAALIALAVHYTPLYYAHAQVENWNIPTSWLVQRYQPGDGLVCYTNAQGCQISVEYYLSRYQSDAHFDADSPGAFSWENLGPANYDAAVDLTALAAYGAQHPRLFFIVARLPNRTAFLKARTAEKWLDSQYHFVGQIVTSAVTIRLYVTEAASSTSY